MPLRRARRPGHRRGPVTDGAKGAADPANIAAGAQSLGPPCRDEAGRRRLPSDANPDSERRRGHERHDSDGTSHRPRARDKDLGAIRDANHVAGLASWELASRMRLFNHKNKRVTFKRLRGFLVSVHGRILSTLIDS
ncbi:unnamed protein product [Euphydryas editha]|uniref:Uncharacterized protein n=1 Tax=Euphydryas editha TaxID=104508 RepID=A0AAU9V7A9_EUPED|nr:unnamed protein product [Euphydryas editha]